MSVPTVPGADSWLDAYLGDDSAGPETLFVALLTADPRDGGLEVAGDGYARVELANTTAVWGEAESGQKSASALFPAPAGDWPVARWWAAAPAVDSDEWCIAGPLSSAIVGVDGDTGPTVTCVARIDRES